MQATLTSEGRITVPSDIGRRLRLSSGDRMSVTVVDDDTIMLKKIAPEAVVSLRGLLARPKQALTIEEMARGVAAHLRNRGR